MVCLVKYLNNALRENTDIADLYNRDLKSGYKVVIVCDSRYREIIEGYNAKEIVCSDDVKKSEDNLFVLYCDNSAMEIAVDCATVLNAECQIYIKYDGIFSADPTKTDFSHRIDKIDYNEILEMTVCGYNAVDTAIVEMARKHGTVLHLLSYCDLNSKGTIIKEVLGISGATIKGIIKGPNMSIITIAGVPDTTGICYRIFDLISSQDIIVDTILLPTAIDGKGEISFTLSRSDCKKCETILKENIEILGFSDLKINDNVAKVSVIGAALKSTKGVASGVFRILYENGIDVKLINTSEIKISVLVDRELSDLAIKSIHKVFLD